MPFQKVKWMLGCAGLSLLLADCSGHLPLSTDSYCQVYNPVVVSRGDGAISAPLPVKKRILANELTYRQECKK